MLDRVYILVVVEIQNNSDLNTVSISLSYHLPGYKSRASLVALRSSGS